MCHQKIHATFSEMELFAVYNTPESIIAHDEMSKFIKWIKKKPVTFYSKNDESASRKRKR